VLLAGAAVSGLAFAGAPGDESPPAASDVKAQPVKADRAHYLITTTDDFIVNVYHNGKQVPDSKRQLLLDQFGATVERINVSVRQGDWLVFNVVNNRLRWGGASYFAVAGCFDRDEFGFVSEVQSGNWSACDDPQDADRFIERKEYLRHRAAREISTPWHEGTPLMQQHAGSAWDGSPLWGSSPNSWIKVILE
jgi:hypothetical protein